MIHLDNPGALAGRLDHRGVNDITASSVVVPALVPEYFPRFDDRVATSFPEYELSHL